MRRRWLRRTVALVVVVVVVLLVLRVARIDRDLLDVVLVVAVILASAWLVLDTLTVDSPAWTQLPPPDRRAVDLDDGLVAYTRILEDHLTAREPGPALRHRLAALADQCLARHHGTSLGQPGASELLGPEVSALLSDPAGGRRLTLSQIEVVVTRIEET